MEGHADVLQLLATVEAPACLAPRDRLELGLLPRLSDDPTRGVDQLHAAAVGSLSPANSCGSSGEAIGFGIRCLLALGELCRELECSERLGLIGGHQSIVRLMTREQVTVETRRCDEEKSKVDVPTTPGESDRKRQQQQQQGSNVGGANPINVNIMCGGPGIEAASDEQDEEEEEEEGDEDEVQAAAALVASRVVSTGCAFPMRPSFPAGEGSSGLGRFPLQYEFAIADGAPGRVAEASHEVVTPTAAAAAAAAASDAVTASVDDAVCGAAPSSQQWKHMAAQPLDSKSPTMTAITASKESGESISILVRPVKERQHSQFDVGFVMWPAAVILSRLLCRDPDLVRGRRVLEIGAGLGLAGLVAARIQRSRSATPSLPGQNEACGVVNDDAAVASVTLSDFNPVVLEALEANVALNADRRGRGRERVHVRHLDWDKLVDEGVDGVVNTDGCGLDHPACGAEQTQVAGSSCGVGCSSRGSDAREGYCEGQEVEVSEVGSCESDSGISSDGRDANAEQREPKGGGMEGIQHGERFDVIIASDHICQASDAEGTIRVLRAMLSEGPPPSPPRPPATTTATTAPSRATATVLLAQTTTTPSPTSTTTTTRKGGEAHFVVAHPRTRWGVDALVPLLQKCPELSFTCEEIFDPELVVGLEEAAYLAWLYVRVWRRPEPEAAAAADNDILLVAG